MENQDASQWGRPGLAQPARDQPGLSNLERAEPGLGPHSLLHPPGDFFYNMNQDNAHVRDKFMNLIEPVAASLPYMRVLGITKTASEA